MNLRSDRFASRKGRSILAICKAHGIGKGDFGVVKTLSNNLSESACNL